ncbi:MAG: Rpn family recombination-promoting nuclease/putative transposase [Acidobacteria bacterium]|nr:Rpn family recombination-promoting nuclease/putative transposase [Acidobacteriota bacterium]
MSYLSNPHDHFFKDLFGRPEIAAEFLATYLPPEVVAELDLALPEPVKDSFVDEDLRESFSDMLYRAQRKRGGDAYVYILLEHKSWPDKWVGFQLLQSVTQIWKKLKGAGVKSLSPVFPVVFYQGIESWNAGDDLSVLIESDADEALGKYGAKLRFYLWTLSTYDKSLLRGAVILRAGLLMMKAIFTPDNREFIAQLKEILELLIRDPAPAATEYLRTILRYTAAARRELAPESLRQVVTDNLPKPEAERLMSTVAEIWVQQGLQQGLQQAQIEMRQRMAEHTIRQLRKRVGALDKPTQARVADLSYEQLESLGEALLDFNTAEDLMAWLREQA